MRVKTSWIDSPRRKRVVLVCMIDSIHTARWINMFANEPIDFYLLASTPNRRIHPVIKALVISTEARTASVSILPMSGMLSIPLWGIDLLTRDWFRGFLLRSIVRRVGPDYVHALELNHGGYIMSRAKSIGLPKATKLIATNWGSDIYWFQRFPRHLRRIKKLLTQIDFYSAECNRDIELATRYGFVGLAHDVFPNAGGFSKHILQDSKKRTSERSLILVKGYESFVGRASIALAALELISEQVREFEIVVYSANKKTSKLVAKLNKRRDLDIKVFPKKRLSHNEMLGLFSKARVYVGVSLSDGISTSLLEAIATGAFPIQTDTSCASEWIIDGKTGFIVKPDVVQVAESIGIALNNDQKVDEAQVLNLQTAKERLSETEVYAKARRFY